MTKKESTLVPSVVVDAVVAGVDAFSMIFDDKCGASFECSNTLGSGPDTIFVTLLLSESRFIGVSPFSSMLSLCFWFLNRQFNFVSFLLSTNNQEKKKKCFGC